MAVTTLSANGSTHEVIAAATEATTAPTSSTDGYRFDAAAAVVSTLVTYAGAVTAAVVRLWVRDAESGEWFKGASSDDVGALEPTTDGREARDWAIGKHREFTFQLESITPSGSTPTVAVSVQGVIL
jgi:hypothetical protein